MKPLLAGRAALQAAAGFTIIAFGTVGPSLAAHAAVVTAAKASTACGSRPSDAVLAAAQVTRDASATTSASATASPSATTAPSAEATASPSPTDGSTTSPPGTTAPSPSPDPSTTSSAPSSPSIAPWKSPQLCVSAQSLSTSSQVSPGSLASFVIWVWTTTEASKNVSVSAQVAAGSNVGTPSFSVCPRASGTSCSVGDLQVGQADALEVTLPVQAGALAGELVELTAQASAAGALGYSCTATDVVASTPAAGSTSSSSALPGTLLPIPGTSVSPVDPSSLFPTVLPSPATVSLPTDAPSSVLPADTTASAVPVNARLDAQLGGIAALGAVIIAVGTMLVRASRVPRTLGANQSQQKEQATDISA